MNILYVVPYAPNKVRVRPYQLIRGLARRGNSVTVLTLTSNPLDEQSVEELRAEGLPVIAYQLPTWRSLLNCLGGLLSPDPLQSFYCWHPALARQLKKLATGKSFDVVHIEHMRGARFGQSLLRIPTRPPVIWDSVDCITHLFQQSAQHSLKRTSRWITRFELSRSRRYEGRLATLFERVLVTSQVDRQAFLELAPPGSRPPIAIIPNGVDLEYFFPGPQEQRSNDTLVVSGKMSYHANVSMTLYLAEQVMPRVWAERPETRLVVAGKDPPGNILALAGDPRITVTGYVEDLRPHLRQAALAVAPLTYGAGIQNKILEAMACATPVVTTPRAVAALSAAPGQDLLVAPDADSFARHVLDLLARPDIRQQVGEAGRCYVEAHHQWSNIAGRLEAIYMEEILRRKKGIRE